MAGIKATQRKLEAIDCTVERVERMLERLNQIIVEDTE